MKRAVRGGPAGTDGADGAASEVSSAAVG
jgi:hypothetical protein